MSDQVGPLRSSHVPSPSAVAAEPAPAGAHPDLGISMIPADGAGSRGSRRAVGRQTGATREGAHVGSGHRRRTHSPLGDIATIAVPAILLALLITVDLVAFLISPLHVGPLPPELVAVFVAATAPLTYTASRRLGLTLVGSVTAAAVAALVLPTASSDVVGAPEHAAVIAGLAAVTLWPFNLTGTVRRYLAGVLGGAAVVASPFAILAIAAAIAWLTREPVDRARRLRALRGPVITGVSVGAVGLLALVVSALPLGEWTWGGAFGLATVIISLGPALGFAAGVGADASVVSARSPEPMPRFAGVVGGLALALLIAAAAGAAAAQIRDRTLVGELASRPSAFSSGASAPATHAE